MRIYHPGFGLLPAVLKHLDGDLLYRQTIGQIRRALPLEQYDLIDIHYGYPDGPAGVRLARAAGVPSVLSLRGSDLNVLTRLARRRERIRRTLRDVTAIIAVTRALAKKAEQLGADAQKIHVVPNGVDLERFRATDRHAARAELGWPRDAHVILSVGNLVELKGFDLLVRAISVLRDSLEKQVLCFLVGSGPLRRRIEKEIRRQGLQDHVFLSGWVAPERLPLWYSAADLSCLLSSSEGCPNVVLESLACGTAVVGSAVGGIPDMVEHGRTGLLVHDRRERQVALLLEEALTTEWDREAISGSEAVRDWLDAARAHFEILERVAG